MHRESLDINKDGVKYIFLQATFPDTAEGESHKETSLEARSDLGESWCWPGLEKNQQR